MKNLLTLTLLFVAISCKAQIIPVENHFNYIKFNVSFPNNAYLKDINGELEKFTGTWLGNYDNKNYEVVIEKNLYISQITSLSIDKLYLRYKITDSNGTVLLNTLTLPNSNVRVPSGGYLDSTGSYQLDYFGYEYDCGQGGTLYIKTFNNNTQMKLSLYPEETPYNEDDCPNGFAEQVFPTDSWMILTKQ